MGIEFEQKNLSRKRLKINIYTLNHQFFLRIKGLSKMLGIDANK